MKITTTRFLASALATFGVSTTAYAGSMDWTTRDKFYEAIAPFFEDSSEPRDLAVRVRDGRAEYRATWGPDTGAFSWSIYPVASRKEAEALIREHAEAENLLGGMDRLCLHKFSRAQDGDKEYFLLYLVDEEQSGLRCVSLAQK